MIRCPVSSHMSLVALYPQRKVTEARYHYAHRRTGNHPRHYAATTVIHHRESLGLFDSDKIRQDGSPGLRMASRTKQLPRTKSQSLHPATQLPRHHTEQHRLLEPPGRCFMELRGIERQEACGQCAHNPSQSGSPRP
jgi:hypothetical protein